MRVLALADLAPRGELTDLLARNRVEAVLCLGDLQPSWIEALAGVGLPKLGVYGNHDADRYMPLLGIEDLHLERTVVDGVSFSGFQGSLRYRGAKEGPQYTQDQAARLVRRLPPADVLITHSPPYGVNDDLEDPPHTGFVALADWVREHQPRYVLHGHTYPTYGLGTARLGATQVRHVRGARVFELTLPRRRVAP